MTTSINKATAATLIKHRSTSKFSQEELADFAGIHRTYVSQIERGLKAPTLVVLFKICSALNIEPHKFVKEIEQRANVV